LFALKNSLVFFLVITSILHAQKSKEYGFLEDNKEFWGHQNKEFFPMDDYLVKKENRAIHFRLPSKRVQNEDANVYLFNRIPKDNPRYKTFALALQLMQEREVKTFVETGTARLGDKNFLGDGGSTIIFADWASQNNAEAYSVDIDLNALGNARAALGPLGAYMELIHSDSIDFLQTFNCPIDFLYLDSYDFDVNDPNPSQQHHLKEIIAAYPYLTEDSIVMIDDCDLPHGGKGTLVIEYLLDRGWEVIAEGYQVILVHKSSYGSYVN